MQTHRLEPLYKEPTRPTAGFVPGMKARSRKSRRAAPQCRVQKVNHVFLSSNAESKKDPQHPRPFTTESFQQRGPGGIPSASNRDLRMPEVKPDPGLQVPQGTHEARTSGLGRKTATLPFVPMT